MDYNEISNYFLLLYNISINQISKVYLIKFLHHFFIVCQKSKKYMMRSFESFFVDVHIICRKF